MIELYHGDCLEIMPTLPAQSVDMILCDPPYGTTAMKKWDSVIPFAPMWAAIERVIKPNGAIVLFGSQPFTSALVMSKPEWFRYEWIWEKSKSAGFLDARRKPLKSHENILVFCDSGAPYRPQMRRVASGNNGARGGSLSHYGTNERRVKPNNGQAFPRSVLYTNREAGALHPTQKPVTLLAYLIRTYTNKGETVLDFCAGSGSTGVACIEEARRFIGIEKDEHYFNVAKNRLEQEQAKPRTMRMELGA